MQEINGLIKDYVKMMMSWTILYQLHVIAGCVITHLA